MILLTLWTITSLISQALAANLLEQQVLAQYRNNSARHIVSVHRHIQLSCERFQDHETSLAESTSSSNLIPQCNNLAAYYPDSTLSVSDPEYSTSQSKYWAAQQSDLRPLCRFLAPSANAVKHALDEISHFNTSFTIVSGGHTSNSGFSNVDGGVTLDLSLLNQTQLSKDRTSVWIGVGARWRDVYRALEPEPLTVAGARVADIGVGGFVLGGGLSWFANQVGFACDSVIAFEVVTPLLGIIYATQNINAGIFWALKGSGGAFGVVTAIKMRTIEVWSVASIYAGAIAFDEDHLRDALSVLAKTSTDAIHDEYTSSYLSFGYLPKTKEFVYNAYIANVEGVNKSVHLNDWRSISSLHSSLRHTTILASAEEISASNPLGLRRSKFTFTTSPQLEKVTPLHTLFRNFASNIDLDHDGLLGMNFQPITQLAMNAAVRSKSPNVFSETLVQDMVPYLIVSVELWWSDRHRDVELESLMRALYEQMTGPEGVGWAKHVWLYPNYAAGWQEPYAGERLGKHTVERLRDVSSLYDPEEVFVRLRSGAWQM